MNWALPLATLCIAGFSLVLSSFFAFRSLSKSASAEYVEQLEHRVAECEADRKVLHSEQIALRREISGLRDREVHLLAQLVQALQKGET